MGRGGPLWPAGPRTPTRPFGAQTSGPPAAPWRQGTSRSALGLCRVDAMTWTTGWASSTLRPHARHRSDRRSGPLAGAKEGLPGAGRLALVPPARVWSARRLAQSGPRGGAQRVLRLRVPIHRRTPARGGPRSDVLRDHREEQPAGVDVTTEGGGQRIVVLAGSLALGVLGLTAWRVLLGLTATATLLWPMSWVFLGAIGVVVWLSGRRRE